MTLAGDSHNHGRGTQKLADLRFMKERCVFWEQQFLDPNAALRTLLVRELFTPIGLPDILPSVAFQQGARPEQTIVETFTGRYPTANAPDELKVEAIGAVLALCIYFGMNDIHAENIFFRDSPTDGLTFGPIDIEILFERIGRLNLTGLIESDCFCHCGTTIYFLTTQPIAKRVKDFAARVCEGYTKMIGVCFQKSDQIDSLLFSLDSIKTQPIRVVLRNTSVYHRYLLEGVDAYDQPNFLAEELEQLNRGDIPYFFRFIDSTKLYFYDPNMVPQPVAFNTPFFFEQRLRSTSGSWSIKDLENQHTQITPALLRSSILTDLANPLRVHSHDL